MDAIITLASFAIESREFIYAFAALLLYDYILCITDEVEYFWTGPWSLSRFLYLSIRYMSLVFALFSITALQLNMRGFHEPLLKIQFYVFILPISTLCQSVITLRVWFLFSRNPVVRLFSLTLLFASAVTTLFLSMMLWKTNHFNALHPFVRSSPMIALVYVPSLVIHTILFALTVYRFFTSSAKMQTDSFLWRFLKEGMLMYACASVSLLLGVASLTTVDPSQLTLRAPALAGSPIQSLIIISVCRAMLSIRSLATTSHVDPEWLLNHAELSRVHWKQGCVSGEIVVEAGESASIPLDSTGMYS